MKRERKKKQSACTAEEMLVFVCVFLPSIVPISMEKDIYHICNSITEYIFAASCFSTSQIISISNRLHRKSVESFIYLVPTFLRVSMWSIAASAHEKNWIFYRDKKYFIFFTSHLVLIGCLLAMGLSSLDPSAHLNGGNIAVDTATFACLVTSLALRCSISLSLSLQRPHSPASKSSLIDRRSQIVTLFAQFDCCYHIHIHYIHSKGALNDIIYANEWNLEQRDKCHTHETKQQKKIAKRKIYFQSHAIFIVDRNMHAYYMHLF